MKRCFFIVVLLILGIGCLITDGFARNVTDPLGRVLTVPESPLRVVALAPSVTEIVYALGQERRLTGVTEYSDFPPEAKTLYTVGSYVKLDIERIVARNPDLCIAIKDGNPKDVVERLMELHIPVYVVDPRSLESVLSAITQIGTLLEAQDRARALTDALQARISRVSDIVTRADRRPRVFIQIGLTPIVSVGTHTFIHELIERAGGINLARGEAPYPRFSREQVLALAPDVIIITSMEKSSNFEQARADWLRWPGLPAARNQRIFIEDANLFNRPSPRLVEGLEHLARLIHPDLFKGAP
jgi:iron complex transport system substrate-binding protein